MIIRTQKEAPRFQEDGTTSYLLVSPWTGGSSQLTTSLVEMEPGGLQRAHRHEPEQIYFFISGTGMMSVEDETWEVTPGDCVLVPANATHSIRNGSGEEPLRYFGAAAPGFPVDQLKVLWPLPSEEQSGSASAQES
jgi:mannose-6-phosphate isomerase-like protein (cupin superfamily)